MGYSGSVLFNFLYVGNFCENLFFKFDFEVDFIVVWECTLYELNYLTLVETCFITQNTTGLSNVPLERVCILLLLGEMFYKYKVD